MRTYSSLPPALDGLLSDDYLYFEGAKRPAEFFLVRDGIDLNEKSISVLEKYSNDLYNLFLRKLSSFVGGESINGEESVKLQALLQELIKVKTLIENNSKAV